MYLLNLSSVDILLTNDPGLVALTAKKEGKEGLLKLGVMIKPPAEDDACPNWSWYQ